MLLLVGPLPKPPLLGGIETGVDMLLKSRLAVETDMKLFNTWRTEDTGRSLQQRLRYQCEKCFAFTMELIRSKPRIVHIKTASGINFYQNTFYVIIARCLLRRVIVQIHGGFFPDFYRHSPYVLQLYIRWVLALTHRVMVLSQFWADYFSTLVSTEKITVVPNALPVADYTSAKPDRNRFGIPADRIAVLFMGTRDKKTEREKGIIELITAVSQLRQQIPQLILVVAGNGAHTNELQAQLGAEGEGWVGVGVVTPEAKPSLYRSVDIFALPSYIENMPNSLLEAMAAGLPSVATDVGAIPEMIDDARSGYLVPVKDSRALADRIARLAIDVEKRRSLGATALKEVSARFDFSVLQSLLSQRYQELT